MAHSFTLDNMEAYFRHYIPCPYHKQAPITNFCLEDKCLKAMCPDCVEQHSKENYSHRVESIKSGIKRSSEKLRRAIDVLSNGQREQHQDLPDPEEYSVRYVEQLRNLRDHIVDEIHKEFLQYQQRIKAEVKTKWQSVQSQKETNSKLDQAIRQLKLLLQSLFNTSTTLQTSRKVSLLDFDTLISYFRSQIQQSKQTTNLNVNISIDSQLNDKIKKTIAQLIEIQPKDNHNHHQYFANKSSILNIIPAKVLSNSLTKTIKNKPMSFQMYPSEMQPNRSNKVFQISAPSTFDSSNPFLHFFETTNRNLHIFPLVNLQQHPKWQVVGLDIAFQIPTFHKSVSLHNGNIYLLGGSQDTQKLSKIFKYEQRTLVEVGNMLCPRSSHSVVTIKGKIFIVGGFTIGGVVTDKCEMFDTETQQSVRISSVKRPCSSSALVAVNSSYLLKIGGTMDNSTNCRSIERYDLHRNTWDLLDPTFDNFRGEFELLSTAAALQINSSQVLVFGGYNEENNNEASDLTYIIEIKGEQYIIKDINLKAIADRRGLLEPQPCYPQQTISTAYRMLLTKALTTVYRISGTL